MDKEILKKILQLDSLIGFLNWQERTQIHHYNNNDTIISKKTLAAYQWIKTHEWQAPKMNYGQDRLLYWYHPDSESWFLDEDYVKIYQKYKEELTQLKYYDRIFPTHN